MGINVNIFPVHINSPLNLLEDDRKKYPSLEKLRSQYLCNFQEASINTDEIIPLLWFIIRYFERIKHRDIKVQKLIEDKKRKNFGNNLKTNAFIFLIMSNR